MHFHKHLQLNVTVIPTEWEWRSFQGPVGFHREDDTSCSRDINNNVEREEHVLTRPCTRAGAQQARLGSSSRCDGTASCTSNAAPAVAAKHTQSGHRGNSRRFCDEGTEVSAAPAPEYQRAAPAEGGVKRDVSGGAGASAMNAPGDRMLNVIRGIITGRRCGRETTQDAQGELEGRGEREGASGRAWIPRLRRDAVSALIASPQGADLRGAGSKHHQLPSVRLHVFDTVSEPLAVSVAAKH